MVVNIDWVTKKRENYRRLFYFTSAEHALTNIKNGRLKISEFDKCNDIFELGPYYLKTKEQRAKHRAWVTDANSKVGLICFSESWKSPLMWGHYAQSGSGVCLVVDVATTNLQKIKYKAKRMPRSNSYTFPKVSLGSAFFKKECSYKHEKWSYEEESRLFVEYESNQVVNEDSKKFFKFGEQFKLAGVINGPKAKFSRKKILDNGGGSLGFFQCRAAFKKFEMTPQEKSSLWK